MVSGSNTVETIVSTQLQSAIILKELFGRGGKNLRETTRDPSPRSSPQDDIALAEQLNQ
jgi:hypothetical protein